MLFYKVSDKPFWLLWLTLFVRIFRANLQGTSAFFSFLLQQTAKRKELMGGHLWWNYLWMTDNNDWLDYERLFLVYFLLLSLPLPPHTHGFSFYDQFVLEMSFFWWIYPHFFTPLYCSTFPYFIFVSFFAFIYSLSPFFSFFFFFELHLHLVDLFCLSFFFFFFGGGGERVAAILSLIFSLKYSPIIFLLAFL